MTTWQKQTATYHTDKKETKIFSEYNKTWQDVKEQKILVLNLL